jgi:hypothetical protein
MDSVAVARKSGLLPGRHFLGNIDRRWRQNPLKPCFPSPENSTFIRLRGILTAPFLPLSFRFDKRIPMSRDVELFSNTPWQQVSEFARQKLIDDGEKRVRLLKLAPGFQEQDWCTRGHTGFVIDGALELEFPDGKITFAAGDPFMVSNGESHKARTGNGSALLFLVDDV